MLIAINVDERLLCSTSGTLLKTYNLNFVDSNLYMNHLQASNYFCETKRKADLPFEGPIFIEGHIKKLFKNLKHIDWDQIGGKVSSLSA